MKPDPVLDLELALLTPVRAMRTAWALCGAAAVGSIPIVVGSLGNDADMLIVGVAWQAIVIGIATCLWRDMHDFERARTQVLQSEPGSWVSVPPALRFALAQINVGAAMLWRTHLAAVCILAAGHAFLLPSEAPGRRGLALLGLVVGLEVYGVGLLVYVLIRTHVRLGAHFARREQVGDAKSSEVINDRPR